MSSCRSVAALLLSAAALLRSVTCGADEFSQSPQQRFGRRAEEGSRVYKGSIAPHWFATNTQFWYRNELPGGAKEFIVVTAEKGTRERAFDHAKLAKALSTASGKEFTADKLPFDSIEFAADVVKMDGMGTANRSKAFHDVCWHNLKDGGFEDRTLWMKAAAAKYPYMNLTCVGVYGTSAGGQTAAAAVLFHPEFYKAAVASCGCHDNRMDKASWNEQWMGYVPPEKLWSKDADNWYSACSNIDNAHRLRGKLMLVVGEMDSNVPPESTYRFVDALIKAGKDFDFIMVPGAGHGPGGSYGIRRRDDFFVRHLLGKETPARNAETKQ